MLSPPDAELVARDDALPGLGLVLDPGRLVEMLRQRRPTIEGPLRYSYLRYKPGVSALVGFRVRSGDQEIDFHARAHRRDTPEKLGLPGRGKKASSFVDTEQGVVVTPFPYDRRLPSLRRFADQRCRQRLFRRLFPDRPEWEDVAVEQLRYKPERRFVGCLRIDGTPAAVMKLHRTAAFAQANSAAKYLESRGTLRLPARLGRSSRHGLVVSEWLDGDLLDCSLADPAFDLRHLNRVGDALAELHAQPACRMESLSREQEIRSLVDVVEGVAMLSPRLARYARTLAHKVANRLAEQRPRRKAIHGDFYPKQIVLAEQQVGVLDLDEAACGDPATDLGNFRAHLWASVIRGELSEQAAESAAEELVEGYRRPRHAKTLRRVDLYAAANLLRLTPHPFRNRDPDWPSQTEAILNRVERMLRVDVGSPGSTSKRTERCKTKVDDPFDLRTRPELSFLSEALDPSSAFERLAPVVRDLPGVCWPLHLTEIRVVRHKAGRRCLVEYEFRSGPAGAEQSITLVGKVRLKGVDRSTWSRMNQLWKRGLHGESVDGVSVPRPVAMIPEWRMWLQQKVPGAAATELLAGHSGEQLARRVAEAIHKLHRLGPPATRRHTGTDELRILQKKLPLVADSNPRLEGRIRQILVACERIADDLPSVEPCPIHRDFYPDHVLVQNDRLHLLDLDLYCQGDPGLDVGNFCAHVQEQSLRQHGRADAMADREEALQERFIELTGEHVRESIDTYLTLSLTRHIYLSGLFPDRRPFTERLVELCEARLALAGQSRMTAVSMPTAARRSGA